MIHEDPANDLQSRNQSIDEGRSCSCSAVTPVDPYDGARRTRTSSERSTRSVSTLRIDRDSAPSGVSGAVPLFVRVLREDLQSALQARGVTARVEQTRGARLWEGPRLVLIPVLPQDRPPNLVEVFLSVRQSNPRTNHLDYSQEAGSH